MGKRRKTTVSDTAPKARKITSGPVRQKARTMKKLVDAVGKVIQKYGYPGLTVANIGKASGVDRKLIYTYFGSLERLIETYIDKKDYWKAEANGMINTMMELPADIGRNQISLLLKGQFETVLNDQALQKIIHWELGETNDLLKRLADSREEMGERILGEIDQDFKDSAIDLRAILALQIGGIYYLSLHAKSNGSKFCGIDINEPEGKERIDDALKRIINLCYDAAESR